MTEATPRPWAPNTCVITGRLVGHPDTCGDCDPCAASIPPPVKAVLDDLAHWCNRFEAAQSCADEALALLREARKSLWGGVAFDRDTVADLSARIDAFLAKENSNG